MTNSARDEAENPQAVATPPSTEEAPPKPVPEPWTPERVLAWNRYLDRYIAGGVLLLVFLSSIRPIVHSSIWSHLRAGERISSGAPITTDTLSYTREGHRWVNIPWLFEVGSWQLYSTVERLLASDEHPGRGEFAGAVALILVNAVVVTAAAWLLMCVRRPGPGLWWTALCVMLALGAIFQPGPGGTLAPAVGGLAFASIGVAPETWSLLFLALTIFLLHRAANLGRDRSLWFLPLVFALWSNIDENFGFGLLVLGAWTAGLLLSKLLSRESGLTRLHVGHAALIFVLCAAATMLNPSLYRAPLASMTTYLNGVLRMFGRPVGPLTLDQLSFFDSESQNVLDRQGGRGMATAQVGYFLVIVWVGLLSFALNWRRFSLPRLMGYIAAAFLWAALSRLAPLFGLVLAATLALNGQEWYLDRFGEKGRVGLGWKLWSDGGRALAIVAIFCFITLSITGQFARPGEVAFGLGVDDSNLAFRSADYIRDLGVEGRVLNLTLTQGDALLWRDPSKKSFIDNRKGLFPESLRDDLKDLRAALRKDDRSAWEPILEKYGGDDPGITTLMVAPNQEQDRGIYESLMRSPHWVLLFDGGNAVVFGRVDKPGKDQGLFTQKRLDADEAVYRRNEPLPDWERPPTPTGMMDYVLDYRNLKPTKPEVYAAERWLTPPGDPATTPLDAARCLMAIRESRRALVSNPDDHNAYRLLQYAYLALVQAEGRVMNESPEPRREPSQHLALRFRQRAAALSFAIQTTPPPSTREARELLAELNIQLAGMFQGNRAFDLERDRLQAARNLVKADFPLELEQRLSLLNEQIDQFRNQLDDYSAQTQAGPLQRAQLAIENGFPGIAIEELLAAENAGVSLALVRWNLLDLYCQTGQPEKAYELLESTTVNDPSLSTGPGTAAYRQGLVNLLLGNYDLASVYWQLHALPPIRAMQSFQTINAARSLLRGQPITATRSLLEVAGTPAALGLIESQAQWEAELGFCLLESGVPQDITDASGNVIRQGAATHFRNSLEVNPTQPLRPLIEYYLKKLGATIPAAPSESESADPAASPKPEPEAAAQVP
jgi:hypothetical protein